MSSISPFRNIDRATPAHLLKRAAWLIALSFFIPGAPQLIAGNRKIGRIGIVATLSYWALFAVAAVLFVLNRSWLIFLVTAPVVGLLLAAFLILYAILYALLALDTLRLLRLIRLPQRARLITLLAMLGVGVLGTSTIGYAGNLAGVQSNLMGGIFTQQGFTQP